MAFLESTRLNRRKIGQRLNYVAGGQSLLPVPEVGLLSAIHLFVTGNMQVTPGTGSAALSTKAPWNLIRSIRYSIGSGTEIINTSGYGMYLVDLCQKLGYEPDDGQVSASFGDDIYDVSAASGANTWTMHFLIPIVPNQRDLSGLILLQAQGTVTNLIIDWNTAGGATDAFPVVLTGDATAAFTGYAEAYLETFTVPANLDDMPPLDRIHQILERTDNIFATGDTTIKLLEENTYLRLIHLVEINGATNTAGVDQITFRYNLTDVPYQLERHMALFLQRFAYTRDFPRGVFLWDFMDQGYPNYGGDRDLVMASGLAELESIITIGSGASLGSNNNVVRTIQQQLIPIQTPQAA